MSTNISNSDDVIDSRDVIARIEELEGERDSYNESDEELTAERRASQWEDNEQEDAAELKALLSLQSDAEGYADDWHHGEALIRDSHFEDYAREFADECYDMKKAEGWPFSFIDWTAAAEALQQDYTSVDFDGVTYWIR